MNSWSAHRRTRTLFTVTDNPLFIATKDSSTIYAITNFFHFVFTGPNKIFSIFKLFGCKFKCYKPVVND